MSYILDALKKSELQRNGEDLSEWNQNDASNAPTIDNESAQKSRFMVAGLIVLIPVLFGLIYWIFFYQDQKPTNATAANSVESEATDIEQRVEIEVPEKKVAPSSSKLSQTTAKVSVQSFGKAQGIGAKSLGGHATSKTKTRASVVFSTEPLTIDSNIAFKKTSTENHKEAMDDVVLSVFELPDAIREALPSLLFSGHVYSSDKKKRHIMINAKKLQEGDTAAAGITLDKITSTGAEFSFKHRRFSLNALQDWEGLR